MAIKVALAAALLAALVALSTAAFADDNYQQQCRTMVRGMQIRPCQSYLRSRSPFNGDEELEFEEEEENTQQQFLNECCQQLRKMDHQHCGCEAIRHAVRQAEMGGGAGYGTAQSGRIYQKARALPRRCNMRTQYCRFSNVLVD